MKKNTVRFTLIASILLHFLGAAALWRVSLRPRAPFALRPRSTEVELIDPDEMLKRLQATPPIGQVVDQDEKAVNDEIPKDPKYLSRHDQTVEKETRAALSGKFQNAQTLGGVAQPAKLAGAKIPAKPEIAKPVAKAEAKPADTQKNSTTKTFASSDDGPKARPTLDALKPKFNQYEPRAPSPAAGGDAGPQASATDDHIKKPIGLQTMLSTREFIYFSYYNRIKDKLRQYWEPKIKEKMERVLREGRTIAASEKITKLVILLDREGTLVKVQILTPSGLSDLDDAAVEAFRQAAPFPNPPKGIVETDGLIRIRWDFILEA